MLFAMYVMMFYPFKTIEVHRTPIKILTPEVKRGESVVYEVDYCKFTDEQAEITISFVDGFSYAQPAVISNIKPGCAVAQRAVLVPANLPAHKYHLRISLAYRMNALRTITKTFETEEFTVVDKTVPVSAPVIDKNGRVILPSATPVPTPVQLQTNVPESGQSAQVATPTPTPQKDEVQVTVPLPTVNLPVPTPINNILNTVKKVINL